VRLARTREQLTVGWNERVALPDWGIASLRAKVDTGARSSALHVEHLTPLGTSRVRFEIVLPGRSTPARVVARISRMGRVSSSSGHRDMRYFVRTRVRIGPLEREIEMSLVDRSTLRFRMLLGRTALGGLLVDPARAGLLRKARRGA